MKKFKVLVVCMLLVAMLSVATAVYAVCDPPVIVDPGTLPFPVDVTLIQNRLLGGVIYSAGNLNSTILSACDPDDDPLVFTATDMPTGMTLVVTEEEGTVLSWTPTADQVGIYRFV